MKKIRIFLPLFLFFAIPSVMNAQVFVGGGLNFGTDKSKVETGSGQNDQRSNVSFGVSPKIGYFLDEDKLVGIDVSLSFSKTNMLMYNPDRTVKSTGIGVTPFFRYYVYRINKFAIFGQAYMGFNFSSGKNDISGTQTVESKQYNLGLGITPGIAYELSDRIELEGFFRGVNFSANHEVDTTTEPGVVSTQTTNSYGFSGNADNIASTGSINIGLIYKF